jgi:AcrR family transcriptional regulator
VEITEAAMGILEEEGMEALTMRHLGESLGIRAPSIYKHLADKRAVEVALIERSLFELGEALHQAVATAGDDRVSGLLSAYRREGIARPNLYRLTTAGRLPRHDLTPGLEDWAGEPFFLATGEPYLAQALWAFAHGMVILELDSRFLDGSDLDRTWMEGTEAFRTVAGRNSPPVDPIAASTAGPP